MKNKETIEEVAERLFPDGCDGTNRSAEIYRSIFVTGAECQAERMGYLIEALKAIESVIDNDNPSHENIWRIANSTIEQFKKTKDGI